MVSQRPIDTTRKTTKRIIMEKEIRQILLDNLISNYDNGNIEDGGIGGGDEAIEELTTLFTKKLEEQKPD